MAESIEMDPEILKEDFESYRKRMKKLHPVINEVLDLLDATGEEYFNGKKELLVSPEDENFICSALELRRKPVAVVLGQVNCGKSTLLNEIFQRTDLVPTSAQCCTARLVYINYAENYESEMWQLVDNQGNALGRPQCLVPPKKPKKKKGANGNTESLDADTRKKLVLPKQMINLQSAGMAPCRNGDEANESSRGDTQAVQQIIQAHIHVDILKYGIQLIDAPGFGESAALDNLFVSLIENDLEPLILYVIDGHQTWRETDSETLTNIKGRYPQATVMFVVNKIDFSKKENEMNQPSDDEDDDPQRETSQNSGSAGKVRRLSELEPKVMDKIKEKGHLGKDESFLTSDLFHCISAKQQAVARKKGNLDPRNEYVAKFQRFEACFLEKMYERMRHLEGRVMNRVITLMEEFLTLFGKQQVGFVAAVNIVPEFIEKAKRAETHLKTQFSKYVDDIIKDDESIAKTLEETKKKVKDVGREKKTEFEALSLESGSSLRDQRAMLSHLWKLFDLHQMDNVEDEEIKRRTKAASFAVKIIDEVLCLIPTDMIAEFEKKMNSRRDRFYSFVKQLRETLADDCLNNLFEQAYKIRNNSEQTPKELGTMRDIMFLKPVINVAQSALFDYVEEGMKALTKQDLHLTELRNLDRWRDQFIESIFSRIQAESICGRLVRICSQKMDEMHIEFIRNIQRMEHLCEEAEKLGDERLKNLGKKVKPPLFLNLCEVYSVRYEMEHGHCIELGEKIGKDGHYTIYECPEDDDLVVYVLKKNDCDSEEEWKKRAVDIFHAYDIMRQTDTIHNGKKHPDKLSLVNCHGLWMPDRETFHVLFDKTDETIVDYVIREQSSLKQCLELTLKVGQGLQLLHHIQYVHLDLRPRNIRMRGSQPKIHLCHWKSPLENIKLHTTVSVSDPEASTEGAEGEDVPLLEVPPFHLHKNFQNCYERTDTSRDLDCYAFGTFIWTICEGSFAAYPENFKQFKDYSELQNALEMDTNNSLLPETPEGRMVGELDQHRQQLYELMKCLWTQPDHYTMEIANDRLAFLTGSNRRSGISNCYFQENWNGLSK